MDEKSPRKINLYDSDWRAIDRFFELSRGVHPLTKTKAIREVLHKWVVSEILPKLTDLERSRAATPLTSSPRPPVSPLRKVHIDPGSATGIVLPSLSSERLYAQEEDEEQDSLEVEDGDLVSSLSLPGVSPTEDDQQ